MSVIWNFPGPKVSAKFLAISAVAGLFGYLAGGAVGAAQYAGGVFLTLALLGWGWANMERYTRS